VAVVEGATSVNATRDTDRRLAWAAFGLTFGLLALRLLVIGRFGLFFDEAYYWLWSTQLQAGYFDHPPMVAYVIRAGTILFGNIEFGVRFVGAVSLAAVAGLCYAIALTLTGDRRIAAWAAILLNLTTAATLSVFTVPDEPMIVFWLAALLGLAKVAKGARPQWWLLIGIMFGLSAASKYTAFFLMAGAALWMLVVAAMRAWLRGPWPYLAAAAALAVFSPVLVWNAGHGWSSFVLQSARGDLDTAGGLSFLSYLATALLVVSPPIFILAIVSVVRILRQPWRVDPGRALLVLTPVPLAVYFGYHAFHDEVGFHWLSPLAAWAAILAPMAVEPVGNRVVSVFRHLAVGLGVVVAGATFFLLGQDRVSLPPPFDYASRFRGWPEFVENVEALRVAVGAEYVIGDRYYHPAYISFYLDDPPPAFHLLNPSIDQEFGRWTRWVDFPAADPSLAGATAIFIGRSGREQVQRLAETYFNSVRYLGVVAKPVGDGRTFGEFAFAVADPKPSALPLFNGWQEP
jgi:hypothetical protein